MTHQESLLNYLVREGYITATQLVKATQIQAQQGGELLQVLVMMDFLTRDKLRLAQHLHEQWQRSQFQGVPSPHMPTPSGTGPIPRLAPPLRSPASNATFEPPMYSQSMLQPLKSMPQPVLPPDSLMNAIPTPHYIDLTPTTPPAPLGPLESSQLPPPTEIEPGSHLLDFDQPISSPHLPGWTAPESNWPLMEALPSSMEHVPVPQSAITPVPLPPPTPLPPPVVEWVAPETPATPAPPPTPVTRSSPVTDAMKTLAMEPIEFLPDAMTPGETPWWMEEEKPEVPQDAIGPQPHPSASTGSHSSHAASYSGSQDALLQQVVNHRFLVQEKLASHAGYNLYLAYDQSTGQPALVRQMPFFSFVTNQHVFRFKKEAEQLLALQHPNIAQTLAYGANPAWGAYLVHEYIEGPTLQEQALQRRHYSLNEVLELFRVLCPALDRIHQRGFPHRNLSLSSLQWKSHAETGLHQLKLLPMGISPLVFAELTVPWMLARHASFPLAPCPEMLRGMAHELTPRADVYALGNLLYEMLAGQPLFSGDTLLHQLQQHAFAYPPSLDTANPDWLHPLKILVLIHHSLLKSPGQRPPSPMLWLQALEQAIQQSPTPVQQEEAFDPRQPWGQTVLHAANEMLRQNDAPSLESPSTLTRLLHRLARVLRSPQRATETSPSHVRVERAARDVSVGTPWGVS